MICTRLHPLIRLRSNSLKSQSCIRNPMPTYDALLLVSFGGPEGPDEVMPFLENVLRGKHVPRERMLEVAEHYQHFGGVSPINEQNRQLIAALEQELAAHGPQLPIYWGNRNWHPLLPDTLRQMAPRRRAARARLFHQRLQFSYSGCRQYRENIAARPGRSRPDGAAGRQAARVLQSPRLHRADGRVASRAAWRRLPSEQRARRPRCSSRPTAFRSRWPTTAATKLNSPKRAGWWPKAPALPQIIGNWSTKAAAARRSSRGWSPMSATALKQLHAAGGKLQRVGDRADRLHLRPHGSACSTSTPRPASCASGSASACSGRRRLASHPRFVR